MKKIFIFMSLGLLINFSSSELNSMETKEIESASAATAGREESSSVASPAKTLASDDPRLRLSTDKLSSALFGFPELVPALVSEGVSREGVDKQLNEDKLAMLEFYIRRGEQSDKFGSATVKALKALGYPSTDAEFEHKYGRKVER